MFDFTLFQFLRDILIVAACFGVLTALALMVLAVRYRSHKEERLADYLKKEFKRPIVFYGVLALALFFAVYASRLVLVRMLLALCYAFVIARVFLRSDPR